MENDPASSWAPRASSAQTLRQLMRKTIHDPFVDVLQETCFVFKYFTHSASKQNYTSIVFPMLEQERELYIY